ncbi:Ig-like domain-containing protein [Pyxidicoccus parkwayensis]|uniref:Ig-like domain-containing protein n=1 Tax=Pyxidicoccus parkwayensis TaxID=2813578 RepID=A0ABX7NS24_9BACT|nr:Ig-like domain-containing protein [Pyxidicoccus parkwaysis]QSQ21692.1 Ig-like domain-containing protein [Pyxidicoccus parkwaysis]
MHSRRLRSWMSLLLFAALGLSACDSLKSEPTPKPVEEEPPPPELRISVSTEGPALCREGTWTLTVSVAGGVVPQRVELVRDGGYGRYTTPLEGPYRYTIDCATYVEGSWSFIARAVAKDVSVESQSVSVVVDRQGPFIKSWSPARKQNSLGEPYPRVDAPLEIVFSEPLLPSSLQAAPTVLRDGNGFTVAHTAVLSEDGRVLRLTPASPLRVPETLRIELAQRNMTDLAGNPLAPDSGVEHRVDYWPFAQAVPPLSNGNWDWLRFALQRFFPERPVAAFVESVLVDGAYRKTLVVQVLKDGTWERLPSPLGPDGDASDVRQLQLEVYGERIVLAWVVEGAAGLQVIHVSRFDGTSWKALGAPLGTGSAFSEYQMVLDGEGNPVMVYREDDIDLRVVRWAEGDWRMLGPALSGYPGVGTSAWYPAIAVDSYRMVVAWSEYSSEPDALGGVFVMEFQDGGWRQLGSPLLGVAARGRFTGRVAIALPYISAGPVVAWVENSYLEADGDAYVYVASWKPSPNVGTPGTWTHAEELQGAHPRVSHYGLRVLMDSQNEPWVVWERSEGYSGGVTYYRKHRPSGWEPEQLVVNTSVTDFRLDANDFPWVTGGWWDPTILRPQ